MQLPGDSHDMASAGREALRHEVGDQSAALDAIRSGGLDAVMKPGPESDELLLLANAERPYRLLVEEMGEGAVTISERGLVLYTNQRFADLVRRDRTSLAGQDITDLLQAEDATVMDTLLATAPGVTIHDEMALVQPDGSITPVLVAVTGLDLGGGIIVRCLIVADLTSRAEAVERYRLLAENASDVVFMAGPDRRVVWMAPSVTAVLGWDPGELVGTNIADLLRPEYRAANEPDRLGFYSGHGVDPEGGYLFEMRTSAGDYRWLSGHGRALTAPDGTSRGAVTGLRDVTDVIVARQAAQAGQAILRATVDSLLDPHVRFEAVRDETGQIVDFMVADANPAACAYDGIAYQDLVGTRMLDHYPGVVGAGLLQQYVQVVETGEPLMLDDVTYTVETIGGQERHLDISAARVGDGLSYTWRDVTDRHEAARQLAESEERLRVTIESAIVGMCLASEYGRFILVNPALCQMLGREREALLGMRWQDVTHPDDMAVDEGLTNDLLAGSVASYQMRKRYLKRDGSIVWGDLSVSCVRNDDGLVRYLVGQIVDVSGHVQAAQALEQATAEFEAAFEYAQGGMALVGRDRRILKANEALSEISGYRVDELTGMRLDDLTDRRDAAVETAQFAEMMAGPDDEYRCELRLVTADGRRRWVSYGVARIGEAKPGNHAVVHVEDITDRKGYEARLLHLAGHDPLTGLANRRRFREDLERYLELATQAKVGGALILLDLDNFKDINDTLGHPTGDALLRAIADVFRRKFRRGDLIARVGGDEFAVLLWALDLTESTAFTQQVIEAVRDVEIDSDGQSVRATVSAGLVMLDTVDGATADDLIANADLAMYEAKERGRDQMVAYDSAGLAAERSRARFHWTDQLRRALDEDRFTMLAQPILTLASGQITGCELLLRMRQDGQLVQPEEFIGIAERQGLVVAIDTRVVQLSTDLAARYRQRAGFRWEINLSAASLSDPDLPAFIASELASKKLAPESFVFEITETAAITNFTKAIAFANRVSDIGCGFALDDFGAGYGSFYYLKHLPCDYLKIDGEFIRDLRTNRTNRVIVQALVSASRALGKQTIAEYVADKPTLDLLRQYGVDHAQGVYVGLPTPPSTGFLTRESRADPAV